MVATLPVRAYGLDRLWNACCWNTAAEHLFAGWLGPGEQRDLLRYIFLSASARTLLPDWEQRARRLLAEFRADCGRMLNDRALDDLVGQLREESDLFAHEWDAQSVSSREGGIRTFAHPPDGAVRPTQHTLLAAERPDDEVVALLPVVCSRSRWAPHPFSQSCWQGKPSRLRHSYPQVNILRLLAIDFCVRWLR